MMRFCPNCQTERSLAEIFCEGLVGQAPCGWDLSGEAIQAPGWRPAPAAPPAVVPASAAAPMQQTAVAASVHCLNGHAMAADDLICLQCGADPAGETGTGALPAAGSNTGAAQHAAAAPQGDAVEDIGTVIAGWRLLRRIGSTDGVRARYIAQQVDTARHAVLTLYRAGAEPDPAVYQLLQRLPRAHVPEILATGRWRDRAYEVAEELSGGTLADLGIVAGDLERIRHIVRELGQALHVFSEAGLRHRDLRPGTLLVRQREPLDLVVSGFGSARLSDFDLDIVSPLETSRYMAPEAIAGGVAAASDWWSLGMILLEQVTGGACFDGIHPQAFLIHVLANGVALPDDLDPALRLLLRGLLARDRNQRWQWPQVQAWLNGEAVAAPAEGAEDAPEHDSGASSAIELGGRRYRSPARFALAAAEAGHWDQAADHLRRGVVVTWAQDAALPAQRLSGLREVARHEGLEDDFRLMLALRLLNPEMPLILRGDIVTPGWLLQHPGQGYALLSGVAPDLLSRFDNEHWLVRLKTRAAQVRQRARSLEIELDEDSLRIHLLSTSRARLAALWEARRRLLPDSGHPGVLSLAERRLIGEEDLIVLLSAAPGLFRSIDAIVADAAALARREDVLAFDEGAARAWLEQGRQAIWQAVDARLEGFARSGVAAIDAWAGQFRLERRLPLAQALVLLAVPAEQWLAPQKQQYVADILDFFQKKVATAVLRGPLVRMGIGKTTARIDLGELHSARRPAGALLDHLLQRNAQPVALDPALFGERPELELRLQSLYRHSTLYRRDTGIDGLYLGFPFLLTRDARGNTKTRIAPVLLWPVRLLLEVGSRGQVALAFDSEREEVRLNPALEALLGPEPGRRWRETADELLGRSALKAGEVMDAFGTLASARERVLGRLPGLDTEVEPYQDALSCAAVLFHVTFMGQAVGEDLRQLKTLPGGGTGLETALRLGAANAAAPAAEATEAGAAATDDAGQPPERDRYFTVASDPSQEAAVLQARQAPGLLVEGPPGTGKSQTIVNMVADALGRQRSLLIVCQKQAALDVVRKRLVAEGLEQRIVMVSDVNRDREPVIRGVREQLESLWKTPDAGPPAWRAQRERVAARIEALEGELDRHQQALHQVDARIGLSYRALLGELLALEQGEAPLDVPALRAQLEPLDTASLAALEERCAPLARYWLPARFEGSPLARLRPFATDRATLADFAETLERLVQTEQARADVLARNPAAFDVEDPGPHRAWLAVHGDALLALDEARRADLARWLPLLRPLAAVSASAPAPAPAGSATSRGAALMAQLAQVGQQLAACAQDAHDAVLSPALATLETRELAAAVARAAHLATPVGLLGRLSVSRWLHRRRQMALLQRCSGPAAAGPDRLPALAQAARLEQQWRAPRQALREILQVLSLPLPADDAGAALAALCADAQARLRDAAAMCERLAQAPCPEPIEAALGSGRRETVVALLAGYHAAFARCEARRLSLAALQRLAGWCEPEWVAACTEAIHGNRDSAPLTAPLAAALPTLAAYQQFRSRAGQLGAAELAIFTTLRDKQAALASIPADALEAEIRRLLNREARLAWKRQLELHHPALLLEHGETAARVSALATADVEMRRLNRALLVQGIERGRVRPLKDWEDITRLTGRRARRLREFIELGAPLGLMALRPVWLMNPDVASRVLPLKAGLFDTVIYDEASQMPVEYALPTLFRGRVAVVSGDEKQMPPTAFFSSRIESDEAELFDGETPDEDADETVQEAFDEVWNRREIKDCPDLLQLARTALPSATLQIHYRSAYRELIGFSNAAFYGNRLSVPVRHPRTRILQDKPLELIRVDGLYQNQTNPAEADKVADLLAALWQAPFAERPSVGVVTFNRKQADLIAEVLEARDSSDAAFRAAYREERERSEGGEDMAVFVKNVENVQGDERDIIVFSTTFGRNGQGSFRRNFGVLGQKGGERRLNVAVTRARRKVVMVTSMPISDISDMLSTRRAPAIPRDFLQSYLEYARTLSDGEFPACEGLLGRLDGERAAGPLHEGGSDPADAPQDGFKAAVAGYVRGLGWQLSPASEGDAFGLDYAIEDPRTGLYALGIECDAPRHALLARARAREIWRPSVLARAIARVHRVSSHGWYHDGDGERARLKAAIEAAMRSGMQAEAGAEIRDTAGAAPQALADSGAANRNVTADADAASAGVRS